MRLIMQQILIWFCNDFINEKKLIKRSNIEYVFYLMFLFSARPLMVGYLFSIIV